MQIQPKKKSFFQHPTATASHCTKANEQSHISSATTYCELAVHHFFFEKHQSCVSCTATLSHRFKAFTPAFCRQNRFRHELPENSAESLSDRALNRSPESRGSQTSGVLLVLFVQAKSTKTSLLQEAPRFCKPRFSSPQWQLRTATIKTFAENIEVFQTSNQHTAAAASHKPIKSFRKLFVCTKSLSLSGRHAPRAFFAGGILPAA